MDNTWCLYLFRETFETNSRVCAHCRNYKEMKISNGYGCFKLQNEDIDEQIGKNPDGYTCDGWEEE